MQNEDLTDALRLAHVPRWSVVPTIRQQYVAEHSYNVAMLTDWLAGYFRVPASYELIMLALTHDLEEAVTGDHPSPIKPDKGKVEPTLEYSLVKLADYLEAYIYLRGEQVMGNTALDRIRGHVAGKAKFWFAEVKPRTNHTQSFQRLISALWCFTCLSAHPIHRGKHET